MFRLLQYEDYLTVYYKILGLWTTICWFVFLFHQDSFGSQIDPHSFASPEAIKTTHAYLDLNVNFDQQTLKGFVRLSFEKKDEDATSVILDAQNLTIFNVSESSTGQNLNYEFTDSNKFGDKLEIKLPKFIGKWFSVRIDYETSPEASGLHWLQLSQTLGEHPFMFSLNQPIGARSMLPCQDTPSVKSSYSATITAPEQFIILMSAIREGEDSVEEGLKTSKFTQKVPIQSYLIAIAVGDVVAKRIGPRSHVWAEAPLLEKAAHDFSETESFLQTAEDLSGPYVWGIYDILVLPPAFAFGGMENPCLTFASPALLSGDRSNAWVIAHEIAHSWTGNLVTNVNMEHFWINEGFTCFVQNKIEGRLFGEPTKDLSAMLRFRDLEEAVNDELGPSHSFTALVPNLTGFIRLLIISKFKSNKLCRCQSS